MALEKKTEPSEIFIRYRGGVPFAAHYVEREIFYEGGAAKASYDLPPAPLPLNSPLIAKAGAAALNRVVELEAEKAAIEADLAAEKNISAKLATENDLLKAQLTNDTTAVAAVG